MSTTKVTDVTMQSTGEGLRVEVTITRAHLPSHLWRPHQGVLNIEPPSYVLFPDL